MSLSAYTHAHARRATTQYGSRDTDKRTMKTHFHNRFSRRLLLIRPAEELIRFVYASRC